ncbi:cytochrome b [Devosia sp.]|uniref:cytochrome b n=1 Tax=Devosia sp. TaxID=1871048 RepID=UPI003BACE9FC
MDRQAGGYTGVQIGLHWLIAAMVFFQLVFGESMTAVIDAAEEGGPVSVPDQILGTAHFWVGIAILVLALARFAVRLRTGAPEHAGDANPMLQLAATAMHWLFYVLLFAVPVLGLLGYYFGDPWGQIHTLAKPVFIVLIVIHAGAALFNQFVLKDGTLMRMLKPAR